MCFENHIFSPPFCIYYITSMQECKAKAYAQGYSPAARILRRASREQAPVGFGLECEPHPCAVRSHRGFSCASMKRIRWRETKNYWLGVADDSSLFRHMKKERKPFGFRSFLVHRAGLEPATPSVGGLCSIQLGYRCMVGRGVLAHTILPQIPPFCKGFAEKYL